MKQAYPIRFHIQLEALPEQTHSNQVSIANVSTDVNTVVNAFVVVVVAHGCGVGCGLLLYAAHGCGLLNVVVCCMLLGCCAGLMIQPVHSVHPAPTSICKNRGRDGKLWTNCRKN